MSHDLFKTPEGKKAVSIFANRIKDMIDDCILFEAFTGEKADPFSPEGRATMRAEMPLHRQKEWAHDYKDKGEMQ